MEITFTAEEIAGLAVMMNNGSVPFMGIATIIPQGVENVYKMKPSFMFGKVVNEVRDKYKKEGILDSFEFTNLTYTMLKSKYQISIEKGEKMTESIFLADNNMAGKLVFNNDGTYTMSDGVDPKALVEEFSKKAKSENYKVHLKEISEKPVKISAEDIEEIFNLMHI